MVLRLKKADKSELDAINKLIYESEMVSTNGKSNLEVFTEKYTIKQPDLLKNTSYVLYEVQRMVGFFMVKPKGDEYELEYFYIEHNQLGKGYGKILWNYVEDICIKNNIRKMDILCGKNVTAFYLKMGAEKIGETDSNVNRGVKVDLLQYQVKPK